MADIQWEKEWGAAFKRAQDEDKPVLVDFFKHD